MCAKAQIAICSRNICHILRQNVELECDVTYVRLYFIIMIVFAFNAYKFVHGERLRTQYYVCIFFIDFFCLFFYVCYSLECITYEFGSIERYMCLYIYM